MYGLAVLVVLGAMAALAFVDWRQLGPPSAIVAFDATFNGDSVTIDGSTDLPDGTILDWELLRGTYSRPAEAQLLSFDSVLVSAGKFTADIAAGPFEPGTVLSIGVRFHPGVGQPPETVARFGPNGEILRGSSVLNDEGIPVLLVTREAVIP